MARLAQYVGATMLFGAPLFFVRNLAGPAPSWTQPLLWGAGLMLLAGAIVSAGTTTALMFGEVAAAFRLPDVTSVLADTQAGRGLAARLALTVAALAILLPPLKAQRRWWALAIVGAAVVASFAWTGHGAATEGVAGSVHLAADIAHLLAAALWLGALVPLLILVQRAARRDFGKNETRVAHDALAGFSGVGTLAVALLIATGLVNSWFLVGVDNITRLPGSLYGQLLLAKLALFVLMLALAAANRFRLTPDLKRRLDIPDASLRALRRSVMAETAAGLLILAAVAWLGTLAPPSAL